MVKFKKKPVVIDAIQFIEESVLECVKDWKVKQDMAREAKNDIFHIQTLEGDMVVNFSDWIIRGVKGEFYLCRDEIFRMTYDKV